MLKRRSLLVLLLVIALPLSLFGSAFAQDDDMDMMDAPPGFDSWDAVLEAAEGATVNWYMWGGSDAINDFVDTTYGEPLMEEYGITLNRVPLADTVDAVNQVLSEAEAGVEGDDGSIDLIWINGENFFTLQQADLLYGPWSENIPNSVLVDWENPAVNLDFGRPVDGFESPWSGAQFHFIYDTARMSEEDLPRSYAELTEWIEANPGRFTYIAPGPGAFQGTRFVKQALFEISGGQEQWVGDFNQELYDEWTPELWNLLNGWEENLWRGGETYPANVNELQKSLG
ncbi:MAG: ABC transporter substrate-binding protein [Chloroflexota bacterium]